MGRPANVPLGHKKNGPAEAATSPSHGPTTLEETAMDKPTDTRTPAPAARTAFNTIVTSSATR